MTKKLKISLFVVFVAILSVSISCLIFNIPSVTAMADGDIVINTEYAQDNEILKYYHQPTLEENFEDNIVNVILKSGYSGEIGFDEFKAADSVSEVIAITYKLKTINKGSKEKFTVDEDENPIFVLKLSTNDKVKVLKVIKQLQKIDMVLVAEPNYIYEAVSDWTPSDAHYEDQWGLNESDGINAVDAWDITTGNNSVKVGIFENGADLNHEDLSGHIFSGNFTGSSTNYHGTHVAGIIGAAQNSYGIAGISKATMYILDRSSFVASLEYAAKNDIKIINASFHFGNSAHSREPYNATHYAAIKKYDGLLICAAGNASFDNDAAPLYPACYDLPNVISVGAINRDGERASFSNYGEESVSIYAPGGNILSTYPQELCTGITRETRWGIFLACECEWSNEYGRWEWVPNGSTHYADGYHYMSGTSMAAPHVTGVAALLLSRKPNLTAAELKQCILDTADDITIHIPEDSDKDGENDSKNVKKLNAYKAVESLGKKYTVTLHGRQITEKVSVAYGEMMPLPHNSDQAPGYTGHEFDGYYSEENGSGTKYYEMVLTRNDAAVDLGDTYSERMSPIRAWDHFSDGDLYVYYKLMECDYSYTNIKEGDGFFDEKSTVHLVHGTKATIKAKTFDGYTFAYFIRDGKQYMKDGKLHTDPTVEWDMELVRNGADGLIYPRYRFSAVYVKNCIAEGTLITLADGEQVPVEQLTGNESLLVWNLYTGTFDTAPILCVDSDPLGTYEVINLYFSDDTQVKVISEHGFWDFDLNKYVYLDKNASEYIGHWFNKQTTDDTGNFAWGKVQLTDVIIQEEYTTAWSPVTYSHLCYYVNGMLSMPGGIEGLFNIFDVDIETMSYDKEAMAEDIEQYGLFTYEEFAEILPVPEEVFEAVNGQYLKVAIGKGLIDLDTIASYINQYSRLFG